MAINVEIIECPNMGQQPGMRAPVPEMPHVKITNISAAGATAFQTTSKFVRIRNRTGGDSVYAHVQLATSSVQAAADKSMLLAAGDSIDFMLPSGNNGALYEVDIRATA